MRCSAARRSAARPPVPGSRRDADPRRPAHDGLRATRSLVDRDHRCRPRTSRTGRLAWSHRHPRAGPRQASWRVREALRPWTHERLRQVRSRPCRTDHPARAVTHRPATCARWARALGEVHEPPPTTARAGLGGRLRSCGSEEEAPHAAGHRESQPTADRQALVGERVGGRDSTTRGRAGTANPTRGGASPHPRPASRPARTITACGRSSPSSPREERYEIQRKSSDATVRLCLRTKVSRCTLRRCARMLASSSVVPLTRAVSTWAAPGQKAADGTTCRRR
jgi:hypothetical protein